MSNDDHIVTRAGVVHPILPTKYERSRQLGVRPPELRLEEAVGLAEAIGLDVVESQTVVVNPPKAAQLLGTGKVDELGALFRAAGIEVVIIDGPLSPIQQRNLERAWQVKVLDRTGLILEIFGQRAQTREGRLQVELAQLRYQRSRLVRTWTHLERQRGGLGKTGGPGETQIESDRRMIRERITKLENRLDEVRKGRSLQRKGRKKVPVPIVALIGYTNAGKSTLFNRLTSADVLAQDMLFATLDPTMRGLTLPTGRKMILSDTVGFISDLPTELVAAFRATLEEVLEADLIVHVRDSATEQSAAERSDVVGVLADLGIGEDDPRVIEVLSKADLLDEDQRRQVQTQVDTLGRPVVLVSAVSGLGLEGVLDRFEDALSGSTQICDILVPVTDPPAAAWLYSQSEVVNSEVDDDGNQKLRVRIDEDVLGRFQKRFGHPAAPVSSCKQS